MAEFLRPTGSTNEDWNIIGGRGVEARGGRSPEAQGALDRRLGGTAKLAIFGGANNKPGRLNKEAEAARTEGIKRLREAIEQLEDQRWGTAEVLEEFRQREPKNDLEAKEVQDGIEREGVLLEQQDNRLAELRGELANLMAGGRAELSFIEESSVKEAPSVAASAEGDLSMDEAAAVAGAVDGAAAEGMAVDGAEGLVQGGEQVEGQAETEIDAAERAARIEELQRQVEQLESERDETEETLAAYKHKKVKRAFERLAPEGTDWKAELKKRVDEAKRTLALQNERLAELRGELAHLVTGDDQPQLAIVGGVREAEGFEQDDESTTGAEEQPEAEGGATVTAEQLGTGETNATGLEKAVDRNGEPAFSQATIENRKALGLEGDPRDEDREAALAAARAEGYVLAQKELEGILRGRTVEAAIDDMSKDAAQVVKELNQMQWRHYSDPEMRERSEQRQEEARNDLASLTRRIQMLQALQGVAAPAEVPRQVAFADDGEIVVDSAASYEDNEFLQNDEQAAAVDAMEPARRTAKEIQLAEAESVAKLLGDPSIVARVKAAQEAGGKAGGSNTDGGFDESAYDQVVEFGADKFDAENGGANPSAEELTMAREAAAEARAALDGSEAMRFATEEAREAVENRVDGKLEKRGGVMSKIKKRFLVVALAAALFITSLTGCTPGQAQGMVGDTANGDNTPVAATDTTVMKGGGNVLGGGNIVMGG